MSSKRKTLIRFLEFFIVGLGFGLAEDLIAIRVTTGAHITFQTVGIVLLIAIPFAAFSELVVDHPNFWKRLIPHNDDEKEKQMP